MKVDYQPLGGDYAAGMAAKFASRDVPDVFYVDAGYANQWIDQGYLAPLDDYIAKSGFDTSQFFDGYASIFKGSDGKVYGLPKDGNTIGMAYNSDLVPDASQDDGRADHARPVAQGQGRAQGADLPELRPRPWPGVPLCAGRLAPVDDGKTEQIDSDASKTAVQWYMDLFKNGLGMTAADLGDDWCGTSLGKKHAAIIFEGGWLDPAMSSTYPDVKYAVGGRADRIVRQPRDDLVHGQLLDGRRLQEQGRGLGPAVLPDRRRRDDQVDRRAASPCRHARTSRARRARTSSCPKRRMPSPARASCPATTTSRRRSRTRSPTRSRRRRSTPVPSSTRPRRRSPRRWASSRRRGTPRNGTLQP